jgi:hypothetical protein
MTTYVLIESGVVVQKQPSPQDGFIQAFDNVVCGMLYDAETGEFTTPEPPPTPIPQVVTMRQARLALLQQGLLANIQAAIDSLDEPAKSGASIEWEYSQTVERTRPFVLTLGEALGLTDDDLDALFELAATL